LGQTQTFASLFRLSRNQNQNKKAPLSLVKTVGLFVNRGNALLLAQAELVDERTVRVQLSALEVVKQAAAL
jgi:hypothetical protein